MEYNTEVDPLQLARDLVELMRLETNLSYEKSQSSVLAVLSVTRSTLNSNDLQPLVTALSGDILDLDGCSDTIRMRSALETLSSFKEDSQQRSWSLHEDQHSILEQLSELEELLKLADKRVSLHVLAEYQYSQLLDLVLFYQMENRACIKLLMLRVFIALCQLDPKLPIVLLPTVLPIELARDIVMKSTSAPEICSYSLDLLSLLHCTADGLPYSHYDVMDCHFVSCMLRLIDSESLDAEKAVKSVISFNLHFADIDENLVIKALTEANSTKFFTENLLLLINRDEDPIWPYTNCVQPYASSIVKIFHDLFSSPIHNIFYRSDVEVLSEVLCRKAVDYTHGKLRLGVLNLLKCLMKSRKEDCRMSEINDDFSQMRLIQSESLPKEERELIEEIFILSSISDNRLVLSVL